MKFGRWVLPHIRTSNLLEKEIRMFARNRSFPIATLFLLVSLVGVVLVDPAPAAASVPDPVLQWIGIMNDSVITAATSPLATNRVAALVGASMFDAVNGIHPVYQSLYVKPHAPGYASQRAAAVQAAYVILSAVYPAQGGSLGTKRDASIAAISATESAKSVQAGVAWGQTVATTILQLRSTDGLTPPPPPFVGVLGIETSAAAVGVWRPTPLLNASGAGPQFATMTPWVLMRPSQFRLPPPTPLSSAEYAADYNEIKAMGVDSGSLRTDDQSELSLFWAGNTPLYWNRIASQISANRGLGLTENAHLFAMMNVAMADAAIACWDSKYRYVFWRPITAIRLGDTDGNPSTDPDPAWTPWLDFFPTGTPAHPEYPSGHSTVSGAAAYILATMFGDNTAFTVTSEVRPGTRSFSSFSTAVAEIADARVFGGIHSRTSCVRGNALGQSVAAYVSSHAMRSLVND
jgi:membrane-associated phospholipid phosphatase